MIGKRLRIARVLSISFCFIFVAVFYVPIVAFAEEEAVGKVFYVRGSVEYLAAGKDPNTSRKAGEVQTASLGNWSKAVLRQPVYLGDEFRTGGKSRIKIQFADKSMIALGPNAKFSVEKYVFDAKQKLRQGVVSVAHGLAMYIVNKSQSHKDSSFVIVTPTANIAARGTQGFVSVTDEATFVANEAGAVDTTNILTACAAGQLPEDVCKDIE
jgi:hypothetical protein